MTASASIPELLLKSELEIPYKPTVVSAVYREPTVVDRPADITFVHRESTERDDKSDHSDVDQSRSDGDQSSSGLIDSSFVDSTYTELPHPTPGDLKEAPRKRRRTTPNELQILETEFRQNNRPCKTVRERIAKLTSMDEKAVQVWFQNKRQSYRRQQNVTLPAAVRTQSMPSYQDENVYRYYPQPVTQSRSQAIQQTIPPHLSPLQAQPQQYYYPVMIPAMALSSMPLPTHPHVPIATPTPSSIAAPPSSTAPSTTAPSRTARSPKKPSTTALSTTAPSPTATPSNAPTLPVSTISPVSSPTQAPPGEVQSAYCSPQAAPLQAVIEQAPIERAGEQNEEPAPAAVEPTLEETASNATSAATSELNEYSTIKSASSVLRESNRGPKSLKLSMSADGKAELIERSPLKQLQSGSFSSFNPPLASRFSTMPVQPVSIEQECASSLLVLKFGQLR